MSFARAALALTVLEALRPAAEVASGTYATTHAGPLVYLEKVGPLDDLALEHRAPVIVIYTGDDDGQAGDKAGPPYERTIEVDIVLSIVTRVRVDDDADAPSALIVPPTDKDLFLALCALEGQVRYALLYGPSGKWFRKIRRKLPRIRALSEAYSEEGVKFAERRLVLTVEVPDDCFPGPQLTAPEGLARLPQPLRDVAAALLDAGYAEELAAAAPVAPAAVPFTGMTLNIDLPPHDGSADVVADLSIPQDPIDA